MNCGYELEARTSVGDNDSEAIQYGFHSNNSLDNYSNSNDSGYKYEEDKCRAIEKAVSVSSYYSVDWSKDGKQW